MSHAPAGPIDPLLLKSAEELGTDQLRTASTHCSVFPHTNGPDNLISVQSPASVGASHLLRQETRRGRPPTWRNACSPQLVRVLRTDQSDQASQREAPQHKRSDSVIGCFFSAGSKSQNFGIIVRFDAGESALSCCLRLEVPASLASKPPRPARNAHARPPNLPACRRSLQQSDGNCPVLSLQLCAAC